MAGRGVQGGGYREGGTGRGWGELPVDFDREKAAGRGVQGGDGESERAVKAGFVVMDILGGDSSVVRAPDS